MLKREVAKEALHGLFRRHMVADLSVLFRTLDTRSRMSVFRRLRELGYRTSFTHGGRYYTLEDVPQFDNNALWFLRGIGFSRFGTLIETVVHLVKESPAGRSYSELRAITSVRVENVLMLLTRQGRIERRQVGRRSLYVACDATEGARQVAERTVRDQTTGERDLSLSVVVEILVEVVRAGDLFVSPRAVVARLVARGQVVSVAQVEKLYERYGIAAEKKTAEDVPSNSSAI